MRTFSIHCRRRSMQAEGRYSETCWVVVKTHAMLLLPPSTAVLNKEPQLLPQRRGAPSIHRALLNPRADGSDQSVS